MKAVALSLLRLGTGDVVLDRSTGAFHYRDAAGALRTTGAGPKALVLRFAATGNATAPVVTVLHNTTGLGAPTVVRYGPGSYVVSLAGGSNAYPVPAGRGASDSSTPANCLDSRTVGRGWNGTTTTLTLEVRNAAGTPVDGGPSDEWVHTYYVP